MSALSHKVVLFARQNLGKRVFAEVTNARGECWDLAFAALASAGAKTPHDYGSIYKWSSKKVPLSQAKPGDIIQYERYQFVMRKTNANGAWEEMSGTIGEPRHTAIIKAIKPHGQVEVYEQNSGSLKTTAVNVAYLKAGEFKEGGTTFKVTVKGGAFKIYRPQPK